MKKNYLAHLTGFRAIAAYLVLIAHSAEVAFKDGSSIPAHIWPLAALGMSIFFVLSGFVIAYTYYEQFTKLPWHKATWQFFVARFARLYPLYIIFLLSNTDQLTALSHATLREELAYLTLTQSWWGMERITFPVAWSISTECFFYLCFALWMLGDRAAHSVTTLKPWVIVAMLFVYAVLTTAYIEQESITTFLVQLGQTTKIDAWNWFRYNSPYVRLGEFVAGVCAARMYMITQYVEHTSGQQKRATVYCTISVLAIITLAVGNAGWFDSDTLLFFLSFNFGYAPFLAYICYACSKYPNILTRLCSGSGIQTAGEISYSVYILQYWLSVLLSYSIYPPSFKAINPWMGMVAYGLITTVAAYYSYRFIEVPCRSYLKKWLS